MLYYNQRTGKPERGKIMMDERMEYIWDTMVELGIATTEELGLATALCGITEETLNRVLYIRTGYRTIEQMCEEEE